jgi:aspartate/methionine/tyrosine aminotransferase
MTMKQPFVMEEVMGEYEQHVDFNLSESGVHPVLLRELLGDDPARLDQLLDTDLNYITICATMLSNHLAALALSPEVRPRLIQRARQYIRNGYPILEQWMDGHQDLFNCTPPQAAAIAFVRYHLDINSTKLMERLAQEKRVLVIPGDHFNMDHFVRISFGLGADYLTTALDRFHNLLGDIAP